MWFKDIQTPSALDQHLSQLGSKTSNKVFQKEYIFIFSYLEYGLPYHILDGETDLRHFEIDV